MEIFTYKSGPIEKLSWGKFIIRGQEHGKYADGTIVGVGKDICLIGETVDPWSERKGHVLTTEMVKRGAGTDIDVLIIGTGFYGALQVPDEVRQFIEDSGIEQLIAEKTPSACEVYNQLFQGGKKVALLAHGTC